MDAFSSSGSTALFYAINHCHFKEAKSLLDAGANPLIYGSKERDPFVMLESHLKDFSEMLSDEEYANKHEYLQNTIDQLNELKQKMLSVPIVKVMVRLEKVQDL